MCCSLYRQPGSAVVQSHIESWTRTNADTNVKKSLQTVIPISNLLPFKNNCLGSGMLFLLFFKVKLAFGFITNFENYVSPNFFWIVVLGREGGVRASKMAMTTLSSSLEKNTFPKQYSSVNFLTIFLTFFCTRKST